MSRTPPTDARDLRHRAAPGPRGREVVVLEPRRRSARRTRSRRRSRRARPATGGTRRPGSAPSSRRAHHVGDLLLRVLPVLWVDEGDADEAHVRPVVRARHRAPRVLRRPVVRQDEVDLALGELVVEHLRHGLDPRATLRAARCRARSARRHAPSTRRSRGRTCSAGGWPPQPPPRSSSAEAAMIQTRTPSTRRRSPRVPVGDAVDRVPEPLAESVRLLLAQEEAARHRRHEHADEVRGDHRDRDRQGERREQLLREAGQEEDRAEGRRWSSASRRDGQRDGVRPLERRAVTAHSLALVAVDRLQHDDRVVDQPTHRQRQSAERERVRASRPSRRGR